jgi:hypothetical protein
VSWHAVDAEGRDVATGRRPQPPGSPSALAAIASAPVAAWPLQALAGDGRVLSLSAALGDGGERVAALLEALVAEERPGTDVEAMARATPAGPVELAVTVVGPADAVEASAFVDRVWLARVDEVRDAQRRALAVAGRQAALEAALHVALLMATERWDPADDTDLGAHVASGAQLWLLGGAVASALAGTDPDPFAAWGRLVTGGWWPVGPSRGSLVLGATVTAGR